MLVQQTLQVSLLSSWSSCKGSSISTRKEFFKLSFILPNFSMLMKILMSNRSCWVAHLWHIPEERQKTLMMMGSWICWFLLRSWILEQTVRQHPSAQWDCSPMEQCSVHVEILKLFVNPSQTDQRVGNIRNLQKTKPILQASRANQTISHHVLSKPFPTECGHVLCK